MAAWTFPEGDRDYLGRIRRLPHGSSSTPVKQHVVSQVILKGFAATDKSGRGWSLTPYDVVRNKTLKNRSPAGCAYVRDFIMYAAESAELVWKTVEDRLHEAVASARRGDLHDPVSGMHRDTITDAIALHFVRSPRLLREEARISDQVTSEVRTQTLLENEAMLRKEFLRRYGILPAGGGALETVLDDALAPWRDYISNGALARVSLESLFERIRDGLRGMPIEVWHVPAGSQLLVSDNAAFTFAYSKDRSTIATNMAFGDSHGAAMPIARDCLVSIGPTDKDDLLTSDAVRLFNEIQIRNADTCVYFKPGSGLERLARKVCSTLT